MDFKNLEIEDGQHRVTAILVDAAERTVVQDPSATRITLGTRPPEA